LLPSTLQIFLITNMVCCTSAIPVLLGLWDVLEPYYGGVSMLASCLISFICTSARGIAECKDSEVVYDAYTYTYSCDDTNGGSSFKSGMTFAWYRNGYQWDYFLVAVGTSAGGAALCVAINYVLKQYIHKEPKTIWGFHPEVPSGEDNSVAVDVDDMQKMKGGSPTGSEALALE
jgi:hypothetical protein